MQTIPRVEPHATESLRKSPKKAFRARYDAGDRTGAIYSAARAAMRDGCRYYVVPGSSYMVAVYRVTRDESMATCSISNGSNLHWSVDPDLTVTAHVHPGHPKYSELSTVAG